jgi:sucrose phosphorylase
LLTPEAIDSLVNTIHQRSKGESLQATGAAANNLDLYQVNCTYYDALGQKDDEYLIARAIQFFVPGVPQVYYTGLLADANDMDLLRRTGVGRDINRHNYTRAEIGRHLQRPVVRSLMDLIRFRNTHPAFAGEFQLLPSQDHMLCLGWKNGGDRARLDVDLQSMSASVTHSGGAFAVAPGAAVEISSNMNAIKALTFLMFAMFAMTTDSVGTIIPEIIKTFHLSLTAAGAFQYSTIGGIAIAAFY